MAERPKNPQQKDGTMKHGNAGNQKSAEYKIWSGIKQRCNYPKHPSYPLYGAKGVRMCAAWSDDFALFLADMGPRPSPCHSIDRWPNNKGNYEPGNCRWATPEEQGRNKSNNQTIKFDGRTITVAEAAEMSGKSHSTILSRLRRGWSPTEVVRGKAKINQGRCVPVVRGDGAVFSSLNEAASATGISPSSISAALSGRRTTCGGFTWSRNNLRRKERT